MPRAKNKLVDSAFAMYRQGMKLKDIAEKLQVPEGTVRRWKCTYKWDSERSEKKSNVHKKTGAPYGNKNAVGNPGGRAPKKNKNAEKYGFFSKYLPEETKEIFDAIDQADPLDLLWHQIQIAYAAIVRAQRIAYVRDKQDRTTNKIGEKNGETISEERWEVQEAWDKQNNFLKAQARAQSELSRMIKQYDEMLHSNWDLVTEEQKTRIQVIKAKAQLDNDEQTEDDGFLEALNSSAAEDWNDEDTGI